MSEPLPSAYHFLAREAGPRVLLEALKTYGMREIAGPGSNPAILDMAREVNKAVGRWYDDDDKAWCAIWMSCILKRAGFKIPDGDGGFDAMRARAFAKWGNEVRDPMLADVLVFERPNGGHVGLYVGEDEQYFHVLGGNQGNEVSIARVAKFRLVAARRCPWKFVQPWNVRKIQLVAAGQMSHNEA